MLFQLAGHGDPAKNVFARIGALAQTDAAGIGLTKFKRQIDADLKDLRVVGRHRVGKTPHGRRFGRDIGGMRVPQP